MVWVSSFCSNKQNLGPFGHEVGEEADNEEHCEGSQVIDRVTSPVRLDSLLASAFLEAEIERNARFGTRVLSCYVIISAADLHVELSYLRIACRFAFGLYNW